MAHYKEPTEREMLFFALGALNVSKDEAINPIHDAIRDFLYPEPEFKSTHHEPILPNRYGEPIV